MLKCDSCDHKEVCSKKEAYKSACEKVNADIGEFEVEVKCKNFKSAPSNRDLSSLQQAFNKKYPAEKPMDTEPWGSPKI